PVDARSGVADAQAGYRGADVLRERVHGSGAERAGEQRRLLAVHLAHGLQARLHERVLDVGTGAGLEVVEDPKLDVAEAVLDELSLELLPDPGGVLVGNEADVYSCAGGGRQSCADAGAVVARL